MTITESFNHVGFLELLAPAFVQFGEELGEENISRIRDFQ